jgi:hypothetical protein
VFSNSVARSGISGKQGGHSAWLQDRSKARNKSRPSHLPLPSMGGGVEETSTLSISICFGVRV